MRSLIITFTLACLLLSSQIFDIDLRAAGLPVPERGFISSQPAETWEQGLICGNGTIGTNMFSRPLDETIIFTHERLFMPTGPPMMPPNLAPRLFEIRRLIDRGLYRQATQLAFDLSDQESFMYPDPFVPAFDMNIKMEKNGKIKDYMRSLDFQTGEAVVHWSDDGGVFERRMFVSRKDGIAVLLIKGSKPGIVSCKLRLKPREPSEKLPPKKLAASARIFKKNITDINSIADKNTLVFSNSFAQAYPGSIQRLEGLGMVIQKNGNAIPDSSTLIISDADQVLILFDIAMIYDPDFSKLDNMKEKLANLPADYGVLLKNHTRIHGELFDRMRLDLGGSEDHNLTTEELLVKSTNEKLSKALIEKEFDAGRYNIISCTSQLPPTLQGVWGGTYNPGWASDFTHNGNVPSAIASMLMGNMPELMLAYTSYIESIVPYLEINAQRLFGARGIVLPSRSTTTGFNNAFAPRFAGAFWIGGAAWAAHFFYDYYLYTGDLEFLKTHALPFMEKCAVFFEDFLYEGPDGKYIFSPTQSPENTPSNTNSQGSFNATSDVAAARELLQNLIAGSEVLGKNTDKIPLWKEMLGKLPDYMIGPDGAIKEWLTPKLEDRHSHRHSSHLYALYDGMPEEIESNPELKAAFKKLIEIKLETHWANKKSGFMSFGLVQLGQTATSLGESELAYRCLVQLVNRYWLNNLASMHNHKSLFNMDISGGMPAVIIKMLVESSPGKIRLLPALPAAWPSGTIEGVLCRGQVEIKNLSWSETNIMVTMVSAKTQSVFLGVPAKIKDIKVTSGDTDIHAADDEAGRIISLEAGEEVTLKLKI